MSVAIYGSICRNTITHQNTLLTVSCDNHLLLLLVDGRTSWCVADLSLSTPSTETSIQIWNHKSSFMDRMICFKNPLSSFWYVSHSCITTSFHYADWSSIRQWGTRCTQIYLFYDISFIKCCTDIFKHFYLTRPRNLL